MFDDKACRRKVRSLRVKCKEHETGCHWTGELRDIEAHRQTCPSQLVECANQGCTVQVRRRDLTSHQKDLCEWRLVECTFCRTPHPHAEEKLHNDQCAKFPLVCSRCQQDGIPREKMCSHIDKDCSETIVSCSFENFGCTFREKRSCLQRHIDAQTNHHLTMACNKVLKLQEELKSQEQLHKQSIDDLKNHFQAQQEQLINRKQTTEQHMQAQEQTNKLTEQSIKFLKGAVRRRSATRGNTTALHTAALAGDVIKIKQLLTTGGAINAGNEGGVTPLMHAARFGHADAVNCLLINGADYSLVDCEGCDALHCAAQGGDPNAITTLISAGAYPNTRTNAGLTPLMLAASCGHADALDTLAAAGGDMCITDDDGWTVVHHAAASFSNTVNTVNTLKKLVDLHQCNIYTRNNKGETPLRLAVNNKNKPVVDYLKLRGARK